MSKGAIFILVMGMAVASVVPMGAFFLTAPDANPWMAAGYASLMAHGLTLGGWVVMTGWDI